MGFIQLTDYSVQSGKATVRLFAHPEHCCFAEVGQQEGWPSTCFSVSSLLENDWAMGMTNASVSPFLEAISFAFFRQPRVLVKGRDNAPLAELFQSFRDWRITVCGDLGISPREEMSAEIYFAFERNKRLKQRQRLLSRSMIWTLLEMTWFMIHPKSEWLGEYRQTSC